VAGISELWLTFVNAVFADAGVSGKWPSYARPREQKLTHAWLLTRSATSLLTLGSFARDANATLAMGMIF
jgi:hypothetical protein